jgi:hypothetical protein
MDISYCTEVTDVGLTHFKTITVPPPIDEYHPNPKYSANTTHFQELYINGLLGTTSEGVSDFIGTCSENLIILEMALMD